MSLRHIFSYVLKCYMFLSLLVGASVKSQGPYLLSCLQASCGAPPSGSITSPECVLPRPHLDCHHPEFLFLKSEMVVTDGNSHLPRSFTSSFSLIFSLFSLLHSLLLLTTAFSGKPSGPSRSSPFLIQPGWEELNKVLSTDPQIRLPLVLQPHHSASPHPLIHAIIHLSWMLSSTWSTCSPSEWNHSKYLTFNSRGALNVSLLFLLAGPLSIPLWLI